MNHACCANFVAIGPLGSVVAVGTTGAQGFAGAGGVGHGVGFFVFVADVLDGDPPLSTASKQVVAALPPLIMVGSFVVVMLVE